MNILWLMSDQHNAHCLGSAGHPNVRTPHLDRIARDGIRFQRAFCNNPICGPSRCSFLSGQYPSHHGITGNNNRSVQHRAPNIARLFRQVGYQTAMIGKAHIPAQWIQEGFEHVRFSDLCDAAPHDPETCHYFKDLIQAGCADDYDHGKLLPGHPGHGNRAFVSKLPAEYSLEAWTGRKAREFLAARDRTRPFFLKVSFQRPHNPYAPPAERANEYDPATLALPDNAHDFLERAFQGKPAFQQEHLSGPRGQGYPFRPKDALDLKRQMAAYFTLITMIDDEIGEIIRMLKTENELENTLIVYVSDHGDFAGEHGLMSKNIGVYECIHRIPFLLSGPNIPAGIVSDELIESVDLYPTLAQHAGLPMEPDVDGQNVLDRRNPLQRTLCEWDFSPPQSRVFALRDERYRFVFYEDRPDDGELYDHARDDGEVDNLFRDPRYQEVRSQFMQILEPHSTSPERVHGWKDDAAEAAKEVGTPVHRLHKEGAKWSEI